MMHFRHGEISTEVDQRPFVFTLIAFSGSLIAMILLLVFAWGDGLAIFAAILLFIVAAASGAVLLAIVTDQAYIEDDLLVMRTFPSTLRTGNSLCLSDLPAAVNLRRCV